MPRKTSSRKLKGPMTDLKAIEPGETKVLKLGESLEYNFSHSQLDVFLSIGDNTIQLPFNA